MPIKCHPQGPGPPNPGLRLCAIARTFLHGILPRALPLRSKDLALAVAIHEIIALGGVPEHSRIRLMVLMIIWEVYRVADLSAQYLFGTVHQITKTP